MDIEEQRQPELIRTLLQPYDRLPDTPDRSDAPHYGRALYRVIGERKHEARQLLRQLSGHDAYSTMSGLL